MGTFVSRVDLRQVSEAQFLREAVEMASLASLRRPYDDAVLASLRDNVARQDAVGEHVPEFFELDEFFHRDLMRLAGHAQSWEFVATAKGHLDRARLLGLRTMPVSVDDRAGEHHQILDAITEDRLEDAADLLRRHLRSVFADIEQIRAEEPDLFVSDPEAQPSLRTVAVWR